MIKHGGRVTAFYYDDRAFLKRVVQAQGTADQREFQLLLHGQRPGPPT